MEKIITVTKTATKQVEPNKVRITVTARGEAGSYAQAVKIANEKCDKAKTALYTGGVNIRGGGITVGAVYDGAKVKGYRASRTLWIVLPREGEAVNKTTDELGKLDSDWRVSFEYAGNDKAELLAEAVKAAREDAEVIASAAGVKLGALVKTEYADGEHASPVMFKAARFGGDDVSPELITLSQTVVCGFEIE
ncbi:MAG: SIMPL domain-containing protein [Clostridiales bacterium]|nr:SIMPL domain-containing protein [Clostridiales bacterium]